MGDFRKAFPSVCREDLVCTLADGPHVNGQCLKLLADILRHDTVVIWHSGYSEATVSQGIPEGGTLGPFGYQVLLDTLVHELLAHNCGLGVGWVIPDVWKGRLWSGLGQPDPALVALLMSALRSASPMPSFPPPSYLTKIRTWKLPPCKHSMMWLRYGLQQSSMPTIPCCLVVADGPCRKA